MSGKWERSTFGAGDLDALVADGVVVEGDVRLPSDESIPAPAADEWVCFQACFHRRFALPLHPFVRGLLYSYRLQLHDLTPNGILHIACFILFCSLGVRVTNISPAPVPCIWLPQRLFLRTEAINSDGKSQATPCWT